MCLGTVVVDSPASPAEVSDVAEIAMEGGTARVTTLFGEEIVFENVVLRRIDMRRGVSITLEHPASK